MTFKLPSLLVLVVLAATAVCCTRSYPKDDNEHFTQFPARDTVIGHHVVSTELPGGGHLKRAEIFYLVVRNDTSAFYLKFMESYSARVTLDIHFHPSMSYHEQLKELERVMQFAVDYFNVRSDFFQLIFLSRLVTTGDLAIELTRDYEHTFASDLAFSHQKMNQFLLQSKLTTDWNNMLRKFDVQIDTVFSETMNFCDPKYLFESSEIETDSATVPDKLLDCCNPGEI